MKKKVIIASTIMLMLTGCSIDTKGKGNNEIQTVTSNVSSYQSSFVLLPVNLPAYSPAIDIVAENIATSNKVVEAKVLEDEFQEYKLPLNKDLQEYIRGLCDKYNLSFEMVLAIIKQESDFDASNNENGSDYGLMQLNKPSGTMKWLAEEVEKDDSFTIERFRWQDEYHNVTAGIWYLNWIRDTLIASGYTSQEQLFSRVLICFNRGLGGGVSYLKNGGNPNNDDYVKKVREFKASLENNDYEKYLQN